MLHPEEDQPVNRSQKSTFKPADSGQFQIGTRTATTAGALNGVLLAGVIRASYLFFVFGMILLLSA